jgi:hypothetical protein
MAAISDARWLPAEIPLEALAPGRRLRLEPIDDDLPLACTVEIGRVDDHGLIVRTLDPMPGPWPDGPDGHRPPEPFAVGAECRFQVPVDGALLVGQTCVLEDITFVSDPHSRLLRLAVPTGASRLQRRRHRRVPFESKVQWRSAVAEGPRRWRSGTAIDLSAGGLRIVTTGARQAADAAHAPPVGEVLDLRFELPGLEDGPAQPIDVSAIVVGTTPAARVGTNVHLKFTHLGTDQTMRLRNVIATRR